MWIYTSTPHTPSCRSAYLVKHRDNFTLFYVLSAISVGFIHYSPKSFLQQTRGELSEKRTKDVTGMC
jgi:hypothetical protein